MTLAGLKHVLGRLRRALTPPGSRAPLDESYQQPNLDPTHVSPASVTQQHDQFWQG